MHQDGRSKIIYRPVSKDRRIVSLIFVTSDVFLTGIAEQVEFGLVGPEDDATRDRLPDLKRPVILDCRPNPLKKPRQYSA